MFSSRLRIVLLAAAVTCWAGGALATSLDVIVNTSANDANESSGTMTLNSTPLQLNNFDWVGCRFTGVNVPQGAYIISAYMTFTAQATDSTAGTVVVYGEAANNSAIFTTSSSNISGRTRTSNSLSWSPGTWSTNVAYASPELRTIAQEIVNRSGWSSGNSMSFLIAKNSGSGHRRSYSYDSSTTQCPKLHIEYVVVTRPVAKRLLFVVTSTSSPTSFEAQRQQFFQDIGYTVTLIAATATQSSFDTAAAANDVAYISEAILSSDVNTKLKSK